MEFKTSIYGACALDNFVLSPPTLTTYQQYSPVGLMSKDP